MTGFSDSTSFKEVIEKIVHEIDQFPDSAYTTENFSNAAQLLQFDEKEIEECALRLASSATEQNNAEVFTYLGLYTLIKEDYEGARPWLENAVLQEHPLGTYLLGHLYEMNFDRNGGVRLPPETQKENEKTARVLFLEAARLGRAEALGSLSIDGFFEKTNVVEKLEVASVISQFLAEHSEEIKSALILYEANPNQKRPQILDYEELGLSILEEYASEGIPIRYFPPSGTDDNHDGFSPL